MFCGVKLYWWCITLGVGTTIMLLINNGTISTMIVGYAISVAIFVSDPDRVITGSVSQ